MFFDHDSFFWLCILFRQIHGSFLLYFFAGSTKKLSLKLIQGFIQVCNGTSKICHRVAEFLNSGTQVRDRLVLFFQAFFLVRICFHKQLDHILRIYRHWLYPSFSFLSLL